MLFFFGKEVCSMWSWKEQFIMRRMLRIKKFVCFQGFTSRWGFSNFCQMWKWIRNFRRNTVWIKISRVRRNETILGNDQKSISNFSWCKKLVLFCRIIFSERTNCSWEVALVEYMKWEGRSKVPGFLANWEKEYLKTVFFVSWWTGSSFQNERLNLKHH